MKKLISSLFIFILLGMTSVIGQLKVDNNGNVTIKPNSTATPLSPLSIGDTGEQNVTVTARKESSGYVLQASLSGNNQSSWTFSVAGITTSNSSYFHTGVRGSASSSTTNSFGRSFGVLGSAGNFTSGYNYGVYGTVIGSNNGAGIVGTTNGNYSAIVPGMYAGYFEGNVRVTGTVTGQNVTSSDRRLKENISSLTDKKTKYLNSVLSMNPVEYNLKQITVESVGDSARVQTKLYDEKSQQFKKKHFGLIAQELKEIYPDLVYEEDDGYLSIDYSGLIPILIQSVKELKSEIDDLKRAQLANNTGNCGNKNALNDKEETLLSSYHQDKENIVTKK